MRGVLQSYKNNIILRRLFAVLSIDILVKASGFFLLPLYLRLMTQQEFGLYNYILSIIQTFALVLTFGLYIPQSKLYHFYSTKEDRGQLLGTLFTTLIVFIVCLFLILLLFGWDDWIIKHLFDNTTDYAKYKVLIVLALVISVFAYMLTNFFYTSEKIREVRAYNIYRIIVINSIAILTLYFLKGNTVSIRLGFTYAIELLLFCLFANFLVKELRVTFNISMFKRSIYLGLPVMLSAMFGIIVNFSDKFLLQKYGSLIDLSNYYLAFSFASIIPLIFASFQNIWLPVFIKEKNVKKNFEKTSRIVSNLFLIFFLLSIAIWLIFMGLLWVRIIPGSYGNVSSILPFVLITQIFAAITNLFSNYLIYFEKTNWVFLSGFLVSIISIGLGVWLIPIYGVWGAVITTLIVNLVYLLIYYYLVLYLKERHLLKSEALQL